MTGKREATLRPGDIVCMKHGIFGTECTGVAQDQSILLEVRALNTRCPILIMASIEPTLLTRNLGWSLGIMQTATSAGTALAFAKSLWLCYANGSRWILDEASMSLIGT